MRNEWGDISICEGERPDFIATLDNGDIIGIEETQCCPSANEHGSQNVRVYKWQEAVENQFSNNTYLADMTMRKRFRITIYAAPEIYIGRYSVKDCCEEIEKHLRHVLEPTKHPKPLIHLIRKIKVCPSHQNIITFDHMTRRDAIKARDLMKSIKDKEEKSKGYKCDGPIWLCVFLPFPENRHPYYIEYDEECPEEYFEQFVKKSFYERIYITSEFKRDIRRIK
jgi:hypothetical protein